MTYFIQKLSLTLTCMITLVGCQTSEKITQNADQVKLWNIVEALKQQQVSLKKINYRFLSQIDRYNHPKSIEINQQWEELEIERQRQFINFWRAEGHIYQQISQPEMNFSTLFTQVNPPNIKVKPLLDQLKPIIQFEQSLLKKYPQALANHRSELSIFNTKNDDILWVVAYADLEQWRVDLLKKQQLIMAYQAQQIAFVPDYTITTQYYLEALAKSNSVIEGEKYEAQMFLGSTDINKTQPRMTVDGKAIPVYNGKGKVRFSPTKTGTYSWRGSITFKHLGRDTTFIAKKQYKVVPK